LEHHPEYKDLGHRAIANVLMAYERHCALFDDWIYKWNDPENKEKHWYQLLFSKLTSNSTFDKLCENQLSIITFNYDRSLEYFLLQAIKAKYGVGNSNGAKALCSIPIIHLYGKLGSLGSYCDKDPAVPYGHDMILRDNIRKASMCIHTINDEFAADNPAFVEARNLIRRAESIYFLGFGYHEENMKRLFTDHGSQVPYNILRGKGDRDKDRKGPHCCGTALGLSPHHQKKLGEMGLDNMKGDYGYRYRHHNANRNSMWFFPETTIYDFLYHSPHSILD
jgi:hypothetical protein